MHPTRRVREHDKVFGDANDVPQAAVLQGVTEITRNSVSGVSDDHLAGQPLGSHLVQQLQGNLGFGQRSPLILGNAGSIQAFDVGKPGVWQIQS
jgi:hypothetical protein